MYISKSEKKYLTICLYLVYLFSNCFFFSRSVETYFSCIENAIKQCGLGEDVLAQAREQMAPYGCKKVYRKQIQFCWVEIKSCVEF